MLTTLGYIVHFDAGAKSVRLKLLSLVQHSNNSFDFASRVDLIESSGSYDQG
jgi:hypothetical protein